MPRDGPAPAGEPFRDAMKYKNKPGSAATRSRRLPVAVLVREHPAADDKSSPRTADSRCLREATTALFVGPHSGLPAMRLTLSALLCALILALCPVAGSAASFGFSEPASCATWTGSLCTVWSGGLGSDANLPSFQALKTKLPLKYARFSVPYNVLADYDPRARRCRPSIPYAYPTVDDHGYQRAGEGWDLLRSQLVLAHAQGLCGDGEHHRRASHPRPRQRRDVADPDLLGRHALPPDGRRDGLPLRRRGAGRAGRRRAEGDRGAAHAMGGVQRAGRTDAPTTER